MICYRKLSPSNIKKSKCLFPICHQSFADVASEWWQKFITRSSSFRAFVTICCDVWHSTIFRHIAKRLQMRREQILTFARAIIKEAASRSWIYVFYNFLIIYSCVKYYFPCVCRGINTKCLTSSFCFWIVALGMGAKMSKQ